MTRIPAPEPGIYYDVPAHEYHAWNALSQSALKHLAGDNTPADFLWHQEHPKEPTKDRILGTGVHTYTLDEEHLFVAPCKTVCDAYRNAVEKYPEETVILDGQLDAVEAMRDSILAHEHAGMLVRSADHRELSVVFDFQGLCLMKARLDLVHVKAGVVADLKKVQHGGGTGYLWEKSVTSWGYHRQAAVYMEAAATIPDMTPEMFFFITVEDKGPYKVNRLPMDQFDMTLGLGETIKLVELYLQCKASNRWPAYPIDRVEKARLQAWRRKELVEELDEYLTNMGVEPEEEIDDGAG